MEFRRRKHKMTPGTVIILLMLLTGVVAFLVNLSH